MLYCQLRCTLTFYLGICTAKGATLSNAAFISRTGKHIQRHLTETSTYAAAFILAILLEQMIARRLTVESSVSHDIHAINRLVGWSQHVSTYLLGGENTIRIGKYWKPSQKRSSLAATVISIQSNQNWPPLPSSPAWPFSSAAGLLGLRRSSHTRLDPRGAITSARSSRGPMALGHGAMAPAPLSSSKAWKAVSISMTLVNTAIAEQAWQLWGHGCHGWCLTA